MLPRGITTLYGMFPSSTFRVFSPCQFLDPTQEVGHVICCRSFEIVGCGQILSDMSDLSDFARFCQMC